MALAVRGVEYTVSIKVGTSIANVDRLAAALRRLNTQVNVSRNAFSAAQPIHNLYAQTLTTLSSSLVRLNSLLPQLSATLNNTAQSQQQLSNSTLRLIQSTRILTVQMQRRLAMQQQQIQQQRVSNQVTAQGATGMHMLSAAIGSMAAILGTARITGFIRDVTLLAGRVENLNTVMLQVGRTASVSDGEMRVMQDRMKELGITTQVSRIILTRFAQNNLKVADSLRIARIAQDAAVVAGLNSSETAERMMIAVQRLDTRMLRNIGILINLRNEYQKVAIATGRYENSLTAGEKQQIVLNAVMRAGTALSGAYESALQDVYKQWTTLERKIEEAQRTIGENFLPVFRVFVSTFDWLLDKIADTESGLARFIAILAGGAAGFGLAASALAAGAAIAALVAFLNPLTIGILVASAAIGVVVASLTGLSEAHRLAAERQEQRIEKHAFESLRLADLADKMERLNDIQNKSLAQQQDLHSAKIETLSLLTDEEKRVIRLTTSYEEFLEVLRGFNRLGSNIGATAQQQISAKEAELAIAEEELAVTQELYDTDPISLHGPALAAAKKKVKELKKEIQSLGDTANQIELRKLNELEDGMENMSRLAASAAKEVESSMMDGLNESAKEVIKQLKILENVSGSIMTEAQIRRQAELAGIEEQSKLAKTLGIIRQKAADEEWSADKLKAAIAEKEEASYAARLQLAAKEEEQLQSMNQLLETRKGLVEGLERARDQASFDNSVAGFKSDMADSGMSDMADGLVEMYERGRDFIDSQKALAIKLKETEEAIRAADLARMQGEEVSDAYIDGLKRQEEALKGLDVVNTETFFYQIQEAQRSLVDSLDAGTEGLKKQKDALEALIRENELYAQGLSSEVISAIMASEEETKKYTEEQEYLLKNLIETRERIDSALEDLREPGINGDKLQEAFNRLGALEKTEEAIVERMGLVDKTRVEQEKKTQRELNEVQEEGAKKELEIREKTFKEITDKFKSTQEKIESLQKAEADKEASTLEKLRKNELEFRKRRGDPLADALGTGMDIVSKFKGDIRGAANKDQAGQLFEQFKQEVFDIFGPNTDFWPQEFKDFMNQEAKNLQKDIDTVDKEHKLRMEEIALEKENFKVQKEQYRQMKRIADFLTGNPEATPADANRLAPLLKPEAVPDTRDARQKRRDAETARRKRAHNRFTKRGRLPEPEGPNRNLGGLPFGVGDAMLSASVAGAQSMGRLSEEATKLNRATGETLGEIVKFADVAAAEMARQRESQEAARRKVSDAINAANMR